MFGGIHWCCPWLPLFVMAETSTEPAVPRDRPVEVLDVRELSPPGPLKETLELLTELPEETVLVQLNDRAPQFLYPKLDDRGYTYVTATDPGPTFLGVQTDGAVVSAIWVTDL